MTMRTGARTFRRNPATRFAAAICFLLVLGACSSRSPTDVETRAGWIRGQIDDVAGVRVFLGIPYASAPVGALRWREPVPVAPWDGVRAADEPPPACVQRISPGGETTIDPQSEDCLYVNVWTPADPANGLLPVMVWIHGGGFHFGVSTMPEFSGANLARRGAIVVTVGYRVDALGFLVHPELTAESPHGTSGNYGILDQIAALQWVRDNITAFGGDPERVTIFGHSAGSVSVNILQASPLARGLFQRAIGQSTAQMDPAAGLPGRRTFSEAEQAGLEFAGAVGAKSLADLRALPAKDLVRLPTWFWPIERDGHVLPDEVYAIFAAGKQNIVPLLAGSTSSEGTTLPVPWVVPLPDERAAFDRLYSSESDPQTPTDVVLWQMRTWADLNARSSDSPTYLYWFDRTPPGPMAHLGAYHGAEPIYVFDNLPVRDWPWEDSDRQLADNIADYWVNFASGGDPNGAGLPHWPPYDVSRPEVMRLASDSGAIPLPRREAIEFLDEYFARRRTEAARE